jgi:hypothetical protein
MGASSIQIGSSRSLSARGPWLWAIVAALVWVAGCANVIVDPGADSCDEIAGAARCVGECVLLSVDPGNCGACGILCESGQSCVDGACQGCVGADCSMDCPGGLVDCGDGTCVDLMSDPDHCGACGAACGAVQTCVGGACQCPSGTLSCGSSCVDIAGDPQNCGSCGSACAPGETCSGGECQCPAGNTPCPGACADLSSDTANCGVCGAVCPAGNLCSQGACVCPAGKVDCGGTCADLTSDLGNCGACGNMCVQGQTCTSSVCACPPGATLCGAACADIASSPSNCGACGNACPLGQTCEGGLCLDVVSAWPTLGGNMRRSGENADELAGPPIAGGWAIGLAPEGLSPVMVAGGRAYTTFGGFNGAGGGKVVALSIVDGTTLWTHSFGDVFSVGQVTLDGGRLYVQNGKGLGNSGASISAFDPATGGLLWSSPIGAQWENYWSPAVAAGRVFMNGGTYSGLYGFDINSGNQLFFNDDLEQYDEWSPAVHNGVVYTYVEGKLRAHDPASGQVQWTTNPGWDWAGWSMRTSPVFSDTHAFVIAPPSIHAIEVATHAIVWSISAGCKGQPAVAGGVVYSICGGKLSARDVNDGSALWAFDGDGALSYPPIIAAGYVYVSSKNNAYAVGIDSHAQAWTAPVGGWLSVAAGRLFVARSNGTLTTYTLANGP